MSSLSTFLDQVFTRKLFAFAGNSLLLYDYLLTLPLEVAHIWNEPWSLIKALFLINRYGNLIGQTFVMLEETGHLSHGSRNFCLAFQVFTGFYSVFSGESIRVFVVMRACAILRFRRSIAMAVNTLYILYAVAIFVVSTTLLLLNINVLQFQMLGHVGICILPLPIPIFWTFWFIPLFLDGLTFLVVCLNLYQLIKGSRGFHPSRLIRVLARDALLFYLVALFNVLLCMVCWTIYSQDPTSFLPVLFADPILTVVGQRLVLNLRSTYAEPDSTYDLSQDVDRQIAEIVDGIELDQVQQSESRE